MIKVKYYNSHDELYKKSAEDGVILYTDVMFRKLMVSTRGSMDYKPFRDSESREFLRNVGGYEIDENDFYSLIGKNGRICMSDLDNDVKYCLVLIHFSLRGQFLSCERIGRESWLALEKMPFDILIACSLQDLCANHEWDGYELLDYPLEVGKKDVIVKNFGFIDAVFSKMNKMSGDPYAYVDEDGQYYIDTVKLEFCWERHLDEVLGYLDSYEYQMKLVNISDKYKAADFIKLILPQRTFNIPYQDETDNEAKQSYDYFANKLKIINHMCVVPDIYMVNRHATVISITKYRGGGYYLDDDIADKYTEFDDMLFTLMLECSPDYETMFLYIDVDETLVSADSLDFTKWCVLCKENSIELFDKDDGLKLFSNMLKEAIDSGDFEISDDYIDLI